MRIVLTGLLIAAILFRRQKIWRGCAISQDRPALEKSAAALQADAEKNQGDANRWYQAAIAYSYLAEVTYETRDKGASERAAEAGVKDADKAISLNGKNADYYRVLGTLCGQMIPASRS